MQRRRRLPPVYFLLALFLLACRSSETTPLSRPHPAETLASSQATDSDYDGVSDTQEQADGTDPEDGSDALTWHPEWTERPRAIFGPQSLADVTSRMARADAPFPTLASRIRSSCNASPAPYDDPDGLDQAAIYTNANIARNCAFLGYLEHNSTYSTKARDILAAFPTDLGQLSLELLDNTDIHVAEALSSAAQALDLLIASGTLDSSTQTALEETLMALSGSFYTFYVKRYPLYWKWGLNNHGLKGAAALGMVGMVLNHREDAATYVSFATTEITFLLDHQSTDDGGYAEGLYYLNYASDNLLPFFLMYHRFAKGASIPYRQHCDTRRPGSGCREEDVLVEDFWVSPAVRALYDWWLGLMMPDGLSPDFDDANRKGTFLGLLAGMTGDGAYKAAWARNQVSPYYSTDCEDLTVETLVVYPYSLASAWPTTLNRFLPEAGTAVFRSGWEANAFYLLLLAEHDTTREGGHEHPDGTQVLIHTLGEYLVMDSGYGSWDQRSEVCTDLNHNIVLIDFEGPDDSVKETVSGADTYLENVRSATGLQAADARTSFSNVEHRRQVYVLENRLAVVVDRLTPDAGRAHSYSPLWHVNGGGDTGGVFIETAAGLEIQRPQADLEVGIASTVGVPDVIYYEDAHGKAGYGELGTHAVMQATVHSEDAAFLTLFVPSAPDARVVAMRLPTEEGIAALWLEEPSSDSIIVATSGSRETLDLSSQGMGFLETDADMAFIRLEGEKVVAIYQEGASLLTLEGVNLL